MNEKASTELNVSEHQASSHAGARADPWVALRRHTPARIALGRVGASLPTAELLAFSMAHVRARDAVLFPFHADALAAELLRAGMPTQLIRSRAADRREYLLRPDFGRRLHPESEEKLVSSEPPPRHRLTVIIGDGLASLAPLRHALPLLLQLRSQMETDNMGAIEQGAAVPHHKQTQGWSLDTIFIATGARVALSDQIGAIRRAEATVMMLGERPGLSAPDSLGIYLTYAPRPGRTDAERNCISNVRPDGLSYQEAAYKVCYMLGQCRSAGRSGVSVRDSSDWPPIPHLDSSAR